MGNHRPETEFRVGLDARSIFMPRPRGTGRNLLDAYRRIPALKPHWEFVLYHQRQHAMKSRAGEQPSMLEGTAELLATPRVKTRRIEIPGDRLDLWFQLRLPLAAWLDRVDLLHLPANAAPLCCPVPYVVTIHDLLPLLDVGGVSTADRQSFLRGVQRAVRGAAHVISPSEATRDELCGRFGFSREQITVVPWAADREIAASLAGEGATSTEQTRAKYGLNESWLLNFSGASLRKNARGLIEAYARLSLELRAGIQLVLVGCEPHSYRVELEELTRQHGVEGECRFLGFVPHGDLVGLLRGARGMVMPSLCEGFGLPILDAFACGTPVLTSRISSMPEVAGAAAVYCDPRSSLSIAEGIERLLNPRHAENLIQAGYQRLEQFTWEQTARRMGEVYQRCLARGRRRVRNQSVKMSGRARAVE